MNSKLKKVISIIILVLVIIGWYGSIVGLGPISKIKDSLKYGLDIDGGVYVVMKADTGKMSGAKLNRTMEQTKEVLTKRVNAMGVSEATVNVEGKNRLRIEMPGVKDAHTAIERIGQTAKLKFTTADGNEYLSGNDVKTAGADIDQERGGYRITMKFTPEGRKRFAMATEKASSGQVVPTVQENGQVVDKQAIVIWLDNDVLTAPVTEQKLDHESCEITRPGGFSEEEASQTAALIRGGALPVSLEEVESSVQTASIGANALDKSIVAGAIGLGIVFVLMILMYNVLGLVADVALALYVLIVLRIMSAMGAVLTLPGIAGIVLGIGMAVDANVIIFSRIKEEIGYGKTIRVAVYEGFKHALVTVMDSQITTLIATIVLYQLGSTVVKGFAITLMISIIVSIFTAVVISQTMVGAISGSRNAKFAWFGCDKDGKPKNLIKKQFKFTKNRKIFYTISAIVILIGLVSMGVRGLNYGIDFTGGTMIQMDMGKKVAVKDIKDTIDKYDIDPTIVYSGQDKSSVIIRTTKSLNSEKRTEIQDTIKDEYKLKGDPVMSSEEFGATIGKEIRGNAIKSILIAAIGMLIYIIFRFKSWKYGVAAVSGILHDVLVLMSVYTVFGIIVNNPFIAAILTIVGYSINDTIVIFDRIRENTKLMRKKPLEEILDYSVNQTLNRSVMTSVTTLSAIVPLLIMVSSQLAQFVLPLMVGVGVGTYSSIFLCTPLFYEFSKNSELSKYERKNKKSKNKKSKNK